MASTVLPNGIIIPEKYSRDWYADLYHNWQELDNLLAGGGANDGTLTIQKNGDTVGTFSANQATDETINITVPDVNNGTLTIQKNGTAVGTFSANSSSDETVNIEVPDVNNGTLTIQQNGTTVDTFTANSSSDKTVNIQCVDLTSNQTVAGNKEFTGTTTAHDLVPSATDTYNFGSSTAQWNNAYIKSLTINGVACGDILTHNASEFVDVSSNQTIGGSKVFSGNFSVNNPSPRLQTKSTTYSSETTSSMTIGDIAFLSNSGKLSAWIVNQLRDDLTTRLCFRVFPQASGAYKGFVFDENCALYPENSNNALGTSTNKWKSFNGINPGALSLPNSAVIDIVSTIGQYLKDNNTNIYTYIAPFDGWICVGIVKGSLRIDNQTKGISNGSESTGYWISHTIPFVKNDTIEIKINKIDATDDYVNDIMWKAYINPCQGNV